MINLDGVSSFAKGGNRRCYVSPINPKRCLKVLHENLLDKLKENSAWYKRLGNNAGLDDNLRERDAYNQRAISSPINSSVWNHLAKWYGMIETNLGPASETELILNDGEIAETLETYLFREGLTPEIQEALKKQVIDSDIVLTCAQIPGKKAPVLIEKSTVENMKENSVIIDLAAGTGGNCEGTEVDKVVEINGVKIVGETDILNTVKHAATKLYSENVRNLIELYIENSDDEIFVEMSS